MINMRFLAFVALWMQAIQAAEILVMIPFPMKSHHNAFQPIIRELANRGHNVTYVTPVPMEKPIPQTLVEVLIPNTLQKNVLPNLVDYKSKTAPEISMFFNKIGQSVIENTMNQAVVQELIHSNDHYDMIIHEGFMMSEPVVALQHKFKALGVTLMPLGDCSWVNEMSGLPDNPSYMMDFKTHFSNDMTFIQRVHNTYHMMSVVLVSYYGFFKMQELMDKFFNYTGYKNRPSITKLASDQALILLNSHHSVGYSFPRAPHVKEVGGINLQPFKPLPKDFQSQLDDSSKGAIYFSLGTNIDMSEVFGEEQLQAFINVFSRLKQRVFWKWNGNKFPNVSANVIMSTWFPQQDLLAHTNIKMFITHGGLLSVIEAVSSSVPLIGIPFYSDQVKNFRHIVKAGYGLHLDVDNITETSLFWTINEILSNNRYKAEAIRRQNIFHDRPMKPVEESVYWIEYVLRHGKVLQPASAQMPFYQLYLFDVIAVYIAGFILIGLLIKKIVYFIVAQFQSKHFRKPKAE